MTTDFIHSLSNEAFAGRGMSADRGLGAGGWAVERQDAKEMFRAMEIIPERYSTARNLQKPPQLWHP